MDGRRLGSGFTLNGAPTEAGRAVLQSVAGSRPQVQALLEHLPAAQAPTGQSATFTLDGADAHRAARIADRFVDGISNNNQATRASTSAQPQSHARRRDIS